MSDKRIRKQLLVALAAFGAVMTFAVLLTVTLANQTQIAHFVVAHPVLAPFIIIAWKTAGMVFVPIPGGTLTFALIPVLGWFTAYLYNVIGSLIGSSIAFWIARKFRRPVVQRLVPLQTIDKWEAKLSEGQEFWAFLVVRAVTWPIFDLMSYAFGLSRISYKRFLAVTALLLIPNAAVYYLGNEFYLQVLRRSWQLGVAVIIIAGIGYAVYAAINTRGSHNNKNTG